MPRESKDRASLIPLKQSTYRVLQRRSYRGTHFGRAAARAESERLRALVEIAEARKILPGRTK